MHREFFSNIPDKTKLFSRFELIRCLSAGTYSAVYLCSDSKKNNEKIALKVFMRSLPGNDKLLDRFFEEIRITQNIIHPNVMHCREWMKDDTFVAYIMDYMECGSLADLIETSERIPSKKILAILKQICMAVQAIHDAGIVHRDLKPENILIDNNGNIKVCDFGIAANMSSPEVKDEDAMIGSINYLSPEYVTHGKFDHRSDIYSLGVLAYELITKRYPFEGDSLIETLTRRVHFNPEEPAKFRPNMPPVLNRLIMRALKRNPNERFKSCTSMLETLENITNPLFVNEHIFINSSLNGEVVLSI